MAEKTNGQKRKLVDITSKEDLAKVKPEELLSKLSPDHLETIAAAYLLQQGIDPRSLKGRKGRVDAVPEFKQSWKKIFLLSLRDTGNIRSACQMAGVTRETFTDAKDQDPQFDAWFKLCKEDAIDMLEMVAWQMASKMDGPMIRFLLQANRPEYQQNVALTHQGNKEKPVEVNVQSAVAVYLPDNQRGDRTPDLLALPAPDLSAMVDGAAAIDLFHSPGAGVVDEFEAQEDDM